MTDNQLVAETAIGALSGALTAFGPVGGTLALLGLSIGGVLSLYGGSPDSPPPGLTADAVGQVVTESLLKQDVRDAWAMIAPTHDWYRDWTVRAKSGEQFSAADMAEFDAGYSAVTGPNSNLRSGLAKLYVPPATIDTTPGQFGVPVLLLAVALHVQVLELGITRTAERGEVVSNGEWDNFVGYLRFWEEAIRSCDRLAGGQVEAMGRTAMQRDPTIMLGSAKLAAEVRRLEITYHGGASADGPLPAFLAVLKISTMIARLQANGHT